MDQSLTALAISRFQEWFGPPVGSARTRVVRSPGRVNLIGEHVDYNEGLVLPVAIDRHVLVTARGRDDSLVRVGSTAFEPAIVEFDTARPIQPGAPAWANFARGVTVELVQAGIPVCGADLLIDATLPVGGGLSSSAAILVGVGTALLAVAGEKMEPDRLALIAQKAERDFVGVPCGIMDQTIVAAGKAGHAMLLDCRDRTRRFVPIDPRELRIVIANTMVHHDLSDGAYEQRVRSCQEGVRHFAAENPAIVALRDVSPAMLQAAERRLDPVTVRRCRHVIGEIDRAVRAAELLGRRRYEDVGELMHQSHLSLQHDYEVSCPELDFLVEHARRIKGVYGARMTGGGFGGCIVALVQPRTVDAVIAELRTSYKARFGIDADVFDTSAAAGAGLLA